MSTDSELFVFLHIFYEPNNDGHHSPRPYDIPVSQDQREQQLPPFSGIHIALFGWYSASALRGVRKPILPRVTVEYSTRLARLVVLYKQCCTCDCNNIQAASVTILFKDFKFRMRSARDGLDCSLFGGPV